MERQLDRNRVSAYLRQIIDPFQRHIPRELLE